MQKPDPIHHVSRYLHPSAEVQSHLRVCVCVCVVCVCECVCVCVCVRCVGVCEEVYTETRKPAKKMSG